MSASTRDLALLTQSKSRRMRVNSTIPTVFVAVSDPIGAGLIANLARPGGNFTGLQNYEASITGKWLAMLKEIEPRLTRAGLVGDSQSTDLAISCGHPRPWRRRW